MFLFELELGVKKFLNFNISKKTILIKIFFLKGGLKDIKY